VDRGGDDILSTANYHVHGAASSSYLVLSRQEPTLDMDNTSSGRWGFELYLVSRDGVTELSLSSCMSWDLFIFACVP
jgi:hypothetical protein